MEITLHAIYAPLIITIITWAIVFTRKYEEYDPYGAGSYMKGITHLAIGVIVTLLSWLLYFAFT